MKLAAIGIAVVTIAAAMLFGMLQEDFGDGIYQFGVVEEYEGRLIAEPVPMLLSDAGGLLLVGQGKHGAAIPDDAPVSARVQGALIEGANLQMIEVVEIVAGEPAETPRPVTDNETIDLVGELVDTKCYLGVMKPGFGKVHRACASVCLEGGVPPGLLITTAPGKSAVVVLADEQGRPLLITHEWAGLRLRAAGVLSHLDGVPVFNVATIDLAGD